MNEQTIPAPAVGAKELAGAVETLRKYAAAKAELTARLEADEQWWEMSRRAGGNHGGYGGGAYGTPGSSRPTGCGGYDGGAYGGYGGYGASGSSRPALRPRVSGDLLSASFFCLRFFSAL